LLAADGGTRHAMALGIVPHVVIGDLDSLDRELRAQLRAAGTQFITHPVDKDETDLELALLHAVERDMDPIIVVAALGLRLDQTIANILLLTMPALEGRDVRLIEGGQTAFIIREEATITGEPGDILSLIPLGGPAHGVTIRGCAFPLDRATLPFGPALGVSNRMTAREATVEIEDGLVLCVHISNNADAPNASKED
jgi:thiamine pyrophosphokinase